MSEITFTSKLVPVRSVDFSVRTSSFSRDNFVDYPWIISSSRVAKDVFTNNVCDCTACLISDGDKALLKHLNPDIEENHVFSNIIKFVSNNFDMNNKNLQAVLIGGSSGKEAKTLFDGFINFLRNFNIPATILYSGKTPTHVAYKTSLDEVWISNKHIDKALSVGKSNMEALLSGFEKVKISHCDEV